jgi:hypothetical protein
VDADTVTVSITNASDLIYVASNASAIANFRIDAVSLAASVQNLSVADAKSLADARLAAPANAVVSITGVLDAATGVTTISAADLAALGSMAAQGYKTFSLNGATISDPQAQSIFNILNPVTGTVTGAVVDVSTLANNYTALGFSSNASQYKESATINLSSISLQADGSATIGARTALTAIAPPNGTAKVTILGGDGQTAVTEVVSLGHCGDAVAGLVQRRVAAIAKHNAVAVFARPVEAHHAHCILDCLNVLPVSCGSRRPLQRLCC